MNHTNNNPALVKRNETIAQDRVQGMVYSEIAKKHGISKPTVSRVLNDSEIKDVVEQGTRQLVSMVPLAIDNYQTFLSDKKHADHYKASKDTLQTTGILASHTQSQTIVNIFNQTNNIISDNKVLETIGRYMDDNDVGLDLGLIDPDSSEDIINIEGDM